MPFTDGNWKGKFEGEPARRDATGFGDLRLALEWNFIGAPALTAYEMRDYRQKTIVGASIRLIAPTGDSLSYAITAGNTAGAFAINPTSGQISVANSAVLDFETTPSFQLTVLVTDDGNVTTKTPFPGQIKIHYRSGIDGTL